MSEQNVEIAEGLYTAWARGEFPAQFELLDREVEYVNPPGAIEPGVRRGLAGFVEALEKVLEGWEAWCIEPERFVAVGDQVAVVVSYRARARQSGIEIEGRESALLTVREGKVVRYEWFHGAEDALEAVGNAG